jgi:ketosteroid isomerase-like protein
MADRDLVLFANEAFYRAFADRDAVAMDDLWAADLPVGCVHPGWEPVTGRAEVMAAWFAILRDPASPPVRFHEPQVFLYGAAAFVICREEVEGQHLVATNIFQREDGRWRIVHHHAGPIAGRLDPLREDDEIGVVH